LYEGASPLTILQNIQEGSTGSIVFGESIEIKKNYFLESVKCEGIYKENS
jgi:hypothetical protein